MKISLDNIGKRYNYEWIFRHFSHNFTSGETYAILGPNGSGKSTLLQIIAGALSISEGQLEFLDDNKTIAAENHFSRIAIAAPYLELVEEFTLSEFLHFHHSFKPLQKGHSVKDIAEIVGLKKALHKQIRYYSSGMKQRVKLAQAIFSDVPVVLLDEPCTNLDREGIHLYQRLVKEYCKERLVLISSNDAEEYQLADHQLYIMDYK